MSFIPSTDQIKSQLQIALPALGAILIASGANKEAGWVTTAELVAGPLAILIGMGWTAIDTTREAILRKASKPRDASTPAPQIILSAGESALADKLPDNVVAK